MGMRISIEGTEVPVEDSTTVQDLKERLDRDNDELATYEENGEVKVLGDRDVISDTVEEGTNISFQPGEGQVFGK
jgi:sulfur carrier protein ThiS